MLALVPAWRASASYGTAFKAPSFNDLYYPLDGFGYEDSEAVRRDALPDDLGALFDPRLQVIDIRWQIDGQFTRTRNLLVDERGGDLWLRCRVGIQREVQIPRTLAGRQRGTLDAWRVG